MKKLSDSSVLMVIDPSAIEQDPIKLIAMPSVLELHMIAQ